MKFDRSVKREIAYVSIGTLLFTAAEIGVFFALGAYTAKVLYGAILSASAGILNFFLLAVTVTRALSYPPEEEAAAKGLLKLSRISRMFFLLAALAVGAILFNWISTLITIFFPRVIIGVRAVAVKREAPALQVYTGEADEPGEPDEPVEPEEPAETDGENPIKKGSEDDGTDENRI